MRIFLRVSQEIYFKFHNFGIEILIREQNEF